MKLPKLKLPKLPDFDVRDAHIYGGLLLGGVGGWQISQGWTLIAVAVVLVLMGIFAPNRLPPPGE